MILPDDEQLNKMKKFYIILGIGSVVFMLGFFLFFFGRPYAFDGSMRDLFLVFAVLLMLPGGGVMAAGGAMIFLMWKKSDDFTHKPNKNVAAYMDYPMGPEQGGQIGGGSTMQASIPPEPSQIAASQAYSQQKTPSNLGIQQQYGYYGEQI